MPTNTRAVTRGGIREWFTQGLIASVVLAVIFVLAACGSGGDAPLDGPPPDAPDATPAGEPDPSNVTSLQTFIETHGYPSSATMARLRIPRLGIDGQVGPKVVGDTAGVMPNPDGPADIAWYDMSAWAGLGGEPGAGGNAIFGGHVDYNGRVPYAGVSYRGLGVFKNLGTLAVGDLIEVDYRGQTLSYVVVWSRQVGADTTDWGQIWSNAVSVDSITLFTCGGEFDTGSRTYADRIVVRAERI